MKSFEFPGSCRANGGNAAASDVAQVMKLPEEIVEERGNSIGTGKHEPVVGIQLQHRIHHVFAACGRRQLDGWDLQNFGAKLLQTVSELSCLFARARHDDAL